MADRKNMIQPIEASFEEVVRKLITSRKPVNNAGGKTNAAKTADAAAACPRNNAPGIRGIRDAGKKNILKDIETQFNEAFLKEAERLFAGDSVFSENPSGFYAAFADEYVCVPLERGYLKREPEICDEKDKKTRAKEFRRWLKKNGIIPLARQVARIQVLMELSPDRHKFKQITQKRKDVLFSASIFDETEQSRL